MVVRITCRVCLLPDRVFLILLTGTDRYLCRMFLPTSSLADKMAPGNTATMGPFEVAQPLVEVVSEVDHSPPFHSILRIKYCRAARTGGVGEGRLMHGV